MELKIDCHGGTKKGYIRTTLRLAKVRGENSTQLPHRQSRSDNSRKKHYWVDLRMSSHPANDYTPDVLEVMLVRDCFWRYMLT